MLNRNIEVASSESIDGVDSEKQPPIGNLDQFGFFLVKALRRGEIAAAASRGKKTRPPWQSYQPRRGEVHILAWRLPHLPSLLPDGTPPRASGGRRRRPSNPYPFGQQRQWWGRGAAPSTDSRPGSLAVNRLSKLLRRRQLPPSGAAAGTCVGWHCFPPFLLPSGRQSLPRVKRLRRG